MQTHPIRHIHILGICGTFMGGLALLARSMGFKVTGADANVYPPMSTQLEEQGIELIQGYDPQQLAMDPDLVVIGNAMSRGNPCVEAVLNQGLRYTSGPQFLADYILPNKWVLAVSGTHGKTSTASMLAWILEYCGYQPGFLIGGIPQNFGVSARLGETDFFVVEADEYDSAFFDKRSKFVHYKPKTLVINNLEFDHADIFEDIGAIQTQFHHLIRMVPSLGKIIYRLVDDHVQQVINQGCWSELETLNDNRMAAEWFGTYVELDYSEFKLCYSGKDLGNVKWDLIGKHNMENAIMAIAAAHHVGVQVEHAMEALSHFKTTKRRLEVVGEALGVTVYDDFAHHPTAIATTLEGLRAKVGGAEKITVLFEPRSNTMKQGAHRHQLANSFKEASRVMLYEPENLRWSLDLAMSQSEAPVEIFKDTQEMIQQLVSTCERGEHVVIMSNGGFDNVHQRLLDALKKFE